jgi:hypothetical protein
MEASSHIGEDEPVSSLWRRVASDCCITDPGVISRILEHMGLDGRVQPRAPPSASANGCE